MNNSEYIINSFRTILEMIEDRGLSLPDHVNKNNFQAIFEGHENKTIFQVVMNKIKILYYLPPKFRWAELKKTLEEDTDGSYDIIFLVVREKVSESNAKLINALALPIQTWELKKLQFNITKHVLVPKHEVIRDDNEISLIVERYSLKNKHQLPHILKNDPMSRYLGLKGGEVVKITRPSPTAGEYILYRCCL
jgi:DNA-directed RNA polymerase I, II, and III subunit RPABC1